MSSKPTLTNAGLAPSRVVMAVDEEGASHSLEVAGESPLTLYVDRHEIATLLTLGSHPEALSLGYLRNRGLLSDLSEITSVQVDWEVETAAVKTRHGLKEFIGDASTQSTGVDCARGTVFARRMDELSRVRLPATRLYQSTLFRLLDSLTPQVEACWKGGAAHACALCGNEGVLRFVSDVSQHNVVDTIAGMMWLADLEGHDKIFYTTGCLTSEMVMKVALMGVPVLVSRSGVTEMGVTLARKVGLLLVARAKERKFLVLNGESSFIRDTVPVQRTVAGS